MSGPPDSVAGHDTALLAPPAGIGGLAAAEAARRLASDGPNQIVPTGEGRRWRRFVGPLADPMVALLLIAGGTIFGFELGTFFSVAMIALLFHQGSHSRHEWLIGSKVQNLLHQLQFISNQPGQQKMLADFFLPRFAKRLSHSCIL